MNYIKIVVTESLCIICDKKASHFLTIERGEFLIDGKRGHFAPRRNIALCKEHFNIETGLPNSERIIIEGFITERDFGKDIKKVCGLTIKNI